MTGASWDLEWSRRATVPELDAYIQKLETDLLNTQQLLALLKAERARRPA